jgi:hypothetical protein
MTGSLFAMPRTAYSYLRYKYHPLKTPTGQQLHNKPPPRSYSTTTQAVIVSTIFSLYGLCLGRSVDAVSS